MTKRAIKAAGFTLVELMVTVVVAAIILTVAIPSFTEFINNNRLVTQTNAFVTSLATTRSEAVKRAKQVTMCKSANGTACTTAGNWEQGWLVFDDDDGDGAVDVGDAIIRVHDGLPAGYTLRVTGNYTNWIAYSGTGTSSGNSGTATGTFRVCTSEANINKSRAVEIINSGRARLQASAASCP